MYCLVFIDTHEGLKGLRVSMCDYANQSWLESIPLYAFPEYFTIRYRCPNIPITPYKDIHEL